MPLIKSKSKEAFQHNLKAEIGAGRPMKQSLAIAYNTKRMSGKKKYAKGGEVNEDLDPMYEPVKRGGAEGIIHLPTDKQEYDEIQDPIEHQREASKVGLSGSYMPEIDMAEMVEQIMQNKRDQMESDDKMIYAYDGIEVPQINRQKAAEFQKQMGIKPVSESRSEPDLSTLGSTNAVKSRYNEKEADRINDEGNAQLRRERAAPFSSEPESEDVTDKYWKGGMIPESNRSTYPKPDFVNSFRKDPDFMSEDEYMNDYMDHASDSDDDKKKKLLSGIMAQIHAENYGRNK